METRLDLSGWSDDPGVVFRMDKGYSTSWTEYGEWKGTFTNIPDKRYGSQGSSHRLHARAQSIAPDPQAQRIPRPRQGTG